MNMMHPVFTPSDMERLVKVQRTTLRGWRHRGYLKGFGAESENGRWFYSGYDLLTFAVAQELVAAGVDLGDAIFIAWRMQVSVASHLSGRTDEFSPPYMAFWRSGVGKPEIRTEGWWLQWKVINSFDEIAEICAPALTVVCAAELAELVPSEFVAFIRERKDTTFDSDGKLVPLDMSDSAAIDSALDDFLATMGTFKKEKYPWLSIGASNDV